MFQPTDPAAGTDLRGRIFSDPHLRTRQQETQRFSEARIFRLAESTTEVSSAERYLYVVRSEVCPIPALITGSGTLWLRAAVAQLWREV